MIGTTFYKSDLNDLAYYNASLWCSENNATIEDKGDRYEVVALPEPTLDEVKADAIERAQLAFAARRDDVRWVGGYGFDCAPEDITNFMAAYTPLLVKGEGQTQYKVWLTEETKGIVTLDLDEMTAVYEAVRASQLEAYAWYERVRAGIEAADSADELTALCTEENIAENAR